MIIGMAPVKYQAHPITTRKIRRTPYTGFQEFYSTGLATQSVWTITVTKLSEKNATRYDYVLLIPIFYLKPSN